MNNNDSLETKVTVDPIVIQQGNYRIFMVRSIGANIKRKVGVSERTVWATLDVPPTQVIHYAYPLFPGAGPQPENTITHTELQDMVVDVMRSLEMSLDTMEVKGDSW